MSDELQIYKNSLVALAPRMKEAAVLPRATLNFHALAGAVYWSDEIPASLDYDERNAMNFILSYRMGVILGNLPTDPNLIDFWETAKRAFPEWAGFSPGRLVSDTKVISFYKKHQGRIERQCAEALREAGLE